MLTRQLLMAAQAGIGFVLVVFCIINRSLSKRKKYSLLLMTIFAMVLAVTDCLANMNDIEKQRGIRKTIQGLWGLITNINLVGFAKGTIYQGPLKRFCVPGMNCYACPAAIMSCPVGSMQAVLCQKKSKFPFYVIGFLSFIGIFVGRFICGWLCLFGLIQELLYMVPVPKLSIKEDVDRVLRFAKYIFLFGFCFFAVIFLRTEFGMSVPYFCKYCLSA